MFKEIQNCRSGDFGKDLATLCPTVMDVAGWLQEESISLWRHFGDTSIFSKISRENTRWNKNYGSGDFGKDLAPL